MDLYTSLSENAMQRMQAGDGRRRSHDDFPPDGTIRGKPRQPAFNHDRSTSNTSVVQSLRTQVLQQQGRTVGLYQFRTLPYYPAPTLFRLAKFYRTVVVVAAIK